MHQSQAKKNEGNKAKDNIRSQNANIKKLYNAQLARYDKI